MKQLLLSIILLTGIIFYSCSSSSDSSDPQPATEVVIGTQTWTTKNLDVSTYRNGDIIPEVQDQTAWAALTSGAWCYYANETANGTVYGKLYNWYAVNDPRGLAPAGWHIPSDEEFTTLTTFLGGELVAGVKMKTTGTIEEGTGLWLSPNDGANNSSKFTGIPGGYRSTSRFDNIHYSGNFWSSTPDTGAWYRGLVHEVPYVIRNGFNSKTFGFSVRCIKDETVRDIDGNTYTVVPIGAQKWTQSNLNVSKYSDGTSIPQVQDPIVWSTLTTGAWCYYENNTTNGTVYGKLYNWYAVNDARGLAPAGYHVPTDAEWTTLTDFLGGESVAGGKMKATGTDLWADPNQDATNSSGFTGLPGGYRNSSGSFNIIGNSGYWWTSSELSTLYGWNRRLVNNNGGLVIDDSNNLNGFSVRCVKD